MAPLLECHHRHHFSIWRELCSSCVEQGNPLLIDSEQLPVHLPTDVQHDQVVMKALE
jgi:hypothetical protein